MQRAQNLEESKKKCELLLQIPDIRFAGLLDPMGNLIAGGFRPDVEPLKDDNERKKCLWRLFSDRELEKSLTII